MRNYTDSDRKRFFAKVDFHNENGCWNWTFKLTDTGYGKFRIGGRKGHVLFSHRVSWEIANKKDVPKGLYVCHKCDNPKCCNPKHLFVGTQFDNMRDMISKGRGADKWGFKNPNNKLTIQEVRGIKILLNMRILSQDQISEFYNTCQTNISKIKLGRRYAEA